MSERWNGPAWFVVACVIGGLAGLSGELGGGDEPARRDAAPSTTPRPTARRAPVGSASAERASAAVGDDLSARILAARTTADADERFAPRRVASGFVVEVPDGLRAEVGGTGARMTLRGEAVELGVGAIGRRGAMRRVAASEPVADARTVSIARGEGADEWWRALPSGLEHGVTLSTRPAGSGELVIDVDVSDVDVQAVSDDRVRFVREGDGAIAEYGDLWVTDATGATLVARLEADDGLRIVVDDTHAVYPVVVDPIVVMVEGTLGTQTLAYDRSKISIDNDGTRIAVGRALQSSQLGSVGVYVRSGSTWTLEQTLSHPSGSAGDNFGLSVSLNGDGTRLAIGAPTDDVGANVDAGSVFVFVRSGSTWTVEQTLTGPPAATGDRFGYSVVLDLLGTRLMVGAPYTDVGANANAGRVYEYLRSGSTWSAGSQIVATTNVSAEAMFGWDVDVDDVGASLVVGAPTNFEMPLASGQVYVVERSGSVWTQAYRLGGSPDFYGAEVSMAGNGLVAAVGAEPLSPQGTSTGTTGGSTINLIRKNAGTWTFAASISSANSPTLNYDGSVLVVGGSSIGFAYIHRNLSTVADVTLLGSGLPGITTGTQLSEYDVSGDGLRFAALNAGQGGAYVLLYPVGTACSGGAMCASGQCVDGFCCNVACGGNSTTDCQACSAALTGGTNGTCAPLNSVAAATTECRPSAGGCDAPEFCVGGNSACPGDTLRNNTFVCRGAAGPCDQAEVCTGVSSACPNDMFTVGGTCRVSMGPCDPAETCGGGAAACPEDVRSTDVCRDSTGPCDPAESCDGADPACPADIVASSATVCRASQGTCDLEERCDGVSGACPGDAVLPNTEVCRPSQGACDPAELCSGSTGSCPGDTWLPVGTVCRAAAPGDLCDVPESCAGGPTCPTDFFQPANTVCRAAVGPCDVAETCSGASGSCPANAFTAQGTVCNAFTTGPCDIPDVCTGMDPSCPTTYRVGGTCRASAGACDVAETCAGDDSACPPDAVATMGTVCGAASGGGCSTAGMCNGTSITCPNATPLPAGTVCNPAMVGNPCDVADVCDGVSDACPSLFASAATACGPSVSGVCDAPDHCAGTSADCVSEYAPTSVTCRAAAGDCDAAENCDGVSDVCPTDAFATALTVCRPQNGACDVAETCTGASPTCPSVDAFAPSTVSCRAQQGACDVEDFCSGAAPLCPADEKVTDGTTCDDQLTCTLTSACQAGACQPALALDCSDGDPCTTDTCAESGGGCQHAPIAACVDAGASDASTNDVGPTSDSGVPPSAEAEGCSCRVTAERRRPSWALALVALVFGLRLGGRRRQETRPLPRP